MLEESKIQLDSKQDFDFIKGELARFLQEQHVLDGQNYEEYYDQICQILEQNIQVDGVDWYELPEELPEVESVDEALENKHNLLVGQVDSLLLEIAEYRRRYPSIAKEEFGKNVDEFLRNIEERQSIEKESTSVNASISGSTLNAFNETLVKFEKLQASVPEVVAKLGRARAVLCEEGSKSLKQAAQPQYDHEESGNTENLAELITRDARVRKQMDLALKIGS